MNAMQYTIKFTRTQRDGFQYSWFDGRFDTADAAEAYAAADNRWGSDVSYEIVPAPKESYWQKPARERHHYTSNIIL